jgi:hypothetical protein
MRRTQIYLSEQESDALARVTRATGKTRSQLIREAIQAQYVRRRDVAETIRAIEESAGCWKGRREDGAAYVERLRSGRLARLYRY